jgi:putative oxidoreductase
MKEYFANAVRSDDYALFLGRIAMTVLFLPGGVRKLFEFNAFLASLTARTLPFGMHYAFPEIWAALAVATEVGATLLLLLGFRTRWVALLLAVFVVIATFTSHRYWEFEGAMLRAQTSSFYKNVGIFGGLLFLYASGAGALSLDELLRWRKGLNASGKSSI